MPNTESAKKRVRQTKKRNALNNWRKRRVKDQTKAFLKAITDGNVDAAETEFRKVSAVLDRIGSTPTLHRNTANRHKSRLAKRLSALKSGGKIASPTGKSSAAKGGPKSGGKGKPTAKAGAKPVAKTATKSSAKPAAKASAKK